MESDTQALPSAVTAPRVVMSWALLLVGICAMYVPTVVDLIRGPWGTDRNGHGPIVLGLAVWYLLFKSKKLAAERPPLVMRPAAAAGWGTLATGVVMYVLGRSQAVYLFEVGSLIPVLMGIVLLMFGTEVLRRLWFAFFFMLFMVPLPGSVTDAVTQPLKLAVSWASEQVLFHAGYPIARSGVVLLIGQYQLLVADACAGLNSLFTLEALGLLYLNVVRHSSALRNIALAILIIPISFTSNMIRVIVLSLITFHLGDAAGQGFLHSFSGMVLFLSALFLIVSLDGALRTGAAFGARTRSETS